MIYEVETQKKTMGVKLCLVSHLLILFFKSYKGQVHTNHNNYKYNDKDIVLKIILNVKQYKSSD